MKAKFSSMQEIERATSPFARECLRRLQLPARANVIDVPCGFGRHTVWLAAVGHNVTAVDIDAHRVEVTEKRLNELPGKTLFRGIISDAEQTLPLEACSFDLAIVIHYFAANIFERVAKVLRPGASLIFETFGAQGHNWRSLPNLGFAETIMRPHFDVRVFRERPCGPEKSRAVVQALAIRHG